MEDTQNTATARLKAILGSQVRIARAFGMTPEHVSRIVSGAKREPESFKIAVEFLERTPPQHWPERWKQ
jgi:DNA-binding transcriptional regulator YdaS (Cro superfamily)